MSTIAYIVEEKKDGTFIGICCQYDGYPSHVGRILKEKYSEGPAVAEIFSGLEIRGFNDDGSIDRYSDSAAKGPQMFRNTERLESFLDSLRPNFFYVWNGSSWSWTKKV